jgi:peroxiredoxin
MPRVSLNTPAPDFTMQDFKGESVRLSDAFGKILTVLVFNRGFS